MTSGRHHHARASIRGRFYFDDRHAGHGGATHFVVVSALDLKPRNLLNRVNVMPVAFSLLIAGIVGGFLSGMFGVGGGLVMVPLLMWLGRMDQRRASATSLIAIVPTALIGSIGYAVGGQINFAAAGLIAIGGIAGAPVGSLLLRRLSLVWLRWLLIAIMVLAAVRLMVVIPVRGTALTLDVGTSIALVALGIVMGLASGLFGIGGGIIVVPALMALFGMGDLAAKGTSLLAMVPAAISGSLPNLRAGLVRLSDGLIMGTTAVLASLGGVALAFLVPPALSGIFFGIFLLVVATRMVVVGQKTPRPQTKKPV